MIKLSTDVSSYPVFEENQVLTSEQLNGITDYLDRQDRLSRVKLSGIGIVCGLDVAFNGDDIIRISKGCGVTSDGDLLFYNQDMVFKTYKPFVDNNANYPLFIIGEKQIPLYELIPEPRINHEIPLKKDKNAKAVKSFEKDTKLKFSNLAALLYLESYALDPDICTGSDCDNKGKEQQNNLKALLISKTDLERIIANFNIKQSLQLDEFALERVLLKGDDINTFGDLYQLYLSSIQRNTKPLLAVLSKSYTAYEPILAEVYDQTNPVQEWQNALARIEQEVSRNRTAIQYYYDLLKDIADTYNEFAAVIIREKSICCPDAALFPKHLMLGTLIKTPNAITDKYRHEFYPSPILDSHQEAVKKAQFLHKRIDYLIQSFSVPENAELVKITPSKFCCDQLSNRAIPFYYQINRTLSVFDRWNFELQLNQKSTSIYSYNSNAYTKIAHVLEPLKYAYFDHCFYRIEGHIGKSLRVVQAELNRIINQFNLPIKVIALQVEKDIKTIPNFTRYPFNDLVYLYDLYRADIYKRLTDVYDFNSKVKDTVKDATNKNVLPPKDRTNSRIAFETFSNDQTTIIEGKVTAMRNELKKDFMDFDHEKFEKDYTDTMEIAANVNKNVKNVTYSSAFTPYETMISDNRYKYLKYLKDVFGKRETDTKKRSLFAEFLKENPGMQHLAGVERGGTFILIYSAGDSRVVADFSLPYHYYEIPVEEEQKTPTRPIDWIVDDKYKWTKLNDLDIYLSKDPLFEDKFRAFEKKFKDYDDKINFFDDKIKYQDISIGTYSNVLNEYVKNKKEITAGGIDEFIDPEMGEIVRTLNELDKYRASLDDKIKKGNATREEIQLADKLDDVKGNILVESVKKVAAGNTDIIEGSEQAKFLEQLGKSAKNTGNTKVLEGLNSTINNISSTNTKLGSKLGAYFKK